MESPKRFVSVMQAAEKLGISVEKLYRIKDDENGTEK
jgi:predicted DNA-binding transcriptional regulator AlpA